jgi:TPR repeat protein
MAACLAAAACEDMRADKAYSRGDYAESIRQLKDLAEHGEARAQYDLGLLYDKGQGVPQSDKEALRWYHLAAQQGDDRAQYNLGLMYANGQGVPRNDMEAYYWVNLAAEQGNKHALDARDYLADRMTPEQVEESKKVVKSRARLHDKSRDCGVCHLFSTSNPE